MKLFLILLISSSYACSQCQSPPWLWNEGIPLSSLVIQEESPEERVIEEIAEPEVYHWDNLYLEPAYPEVIVNPYSTGLTDEY